MKKMPKNFWISAVAIVLIVASFFFNWFFARLDPDVSGFTARNVHQLRDMFDLNVWVNSLEHVDEHLLLPFIGEPGDTFTADEIPTFRAAVDMIMASHGIDRFYTADGPLELTRGVWATAPHLTVPHADLPFGFYPTFGFALDAVMRDLNIASFYTEDGEFPLSQIPSEWLNQQAFYSEVITFGEVLYQLRAPVFGVVSFVNDMGEEILLFPNVNEENLPAFTWENAAANTLLHGLTEIPTLSEAVDMVMEALGIIQLNTANGPLLRIPALRAVDEGLNEPFADITFGHVPTFGEALDMVMADLGIEEFFTPDGEALVRDADIFTEPAFAAAVIPSIADILNILVQRGVTHFINDNGELVYILPDQAAFDALIAERTVVEEYFEYEYDEDVIYDEENVAENIDENVNDDEIIILAILLDDEAFTAVFHDNLAAIPTLGDAVRIVMDSLSMSILYTDDSIFELEDEIHGFDAPAFIGAVVPTTLQILQTARGADIGVTAFVNADGLMYHLFPVAATENMLSAFDRPAFPEASITTRVEILQAIYALGATHFYTADGERFEMFPTGAAETRRNILDGPAFNPGAAPNYAIMFNVLRQAPYNARSFVMADGETFLLFPNTVETLEIVGARTANMFGLSNIINDIENIVDARLGVLFTYEEDILYNTPNFTTAGIFNASGQITVYTGLAIVLIALALCFLGKKWWNRIAMAGFGVTSIGLILILAAVVNINNNLLAIDILPPIRGLAGITLFPLIVTLISIIVLFVNNTGWYYRLELRKKTAVWGIVLLAPWILGFLLFFARPFGQLVYWSFSETELTTRGIVTTRHDHDLERIHREFDWYRNTIERRDERLAESTANFATAAAYQQRADNARYAGDTAAAANYDRSADSYTRQGERYYRRAGRSDSWGNVLVWLYNTFYNYYDAMALNPNFNRFVVTMFTHTLLQVVIIVIFSLLAAILISGNFPGKSAARTIFFIPIILGASIVSADTTTAQAQLMQEMMGTAAQATAGQSAGSIIVQDVLVNSGLPQDLFGMDVAQVLGDVLSNVLTILAVSAVPTLIFLAGLQSIAPSLYEVAKIEGATGYETFWKVTFPMVSPMVLLCTIYTMVDVFQRHSINQSDGSAGIGFTHVGTGLFQQGTMISFIRNIAINPPANHALSAAMSIIYIVIVVAIIAIVGKLISKVVFYHD
ncbi:MAG: hypothetical protein FWC95_04670 [Defluviitaleaceae bacterium]|nr:hypothetical protein [Defluviitaleaceae bacterium]